MDARGLKHKQPRTGQIYDARVSKTEPLTVTLDAFGDEHDWEPCRWFPADGDPPGRGSRVLALVSDSGLLWVTG